MKRMMLPLTLALLFSLTACGSDSDDDKSNGKTTAEQIGKKRCECEKLEKKARKSDSEKKKREANKCWYEYRAMQADFSLSNFDELWELRDKDKKDWPEKWEELEELVEKAYDNCMDDDEDDD